MTETPERILGHALDGEPFWEPRRAGAAVVVAPNGNGPSTGFALPLEMLHRPPVIRDSFGVIADDAPEDGHG